MYSVKVTLTPQEFEEYLRLRGRLNQRQIEELVSLYEEYAPFYDRCPKGNSSRDILNILEKVKS